MLFFSLTILSLSFIIYEDFKARAIHWYWLLFLLVGILGLENISIKDGIVGLAFMAFQLFVVTVYFSIKQRRLVNISKDYFGIGDTLFLIPLCFYFDIKRLLIFWIVGLLINILGFLIIKKTLKTDLQTIPFAGGMSLVLIVWIFYDTLT